MICADNFGKNLAEILVALDISALEFADRAEVSRATVYNYLHGKSMPELKTICKILNTIPVKFERLVQ